MPFGLLKSSTDNKHQIPRAPAPPPQTPGAPLFWGLRKSWPRKAGQSELGSSGAVTLARPNAVQRKFLMLIPLAASRW